MRQRQTVPLQIMGARYLAIRRTDLDHSEAALSPVAAWRVLERALLHPSDANQLIALQRSMAEGQVRSRPGIHEPALRHAFQTGTWTLLPTAKRTPVLANQPAESPADQVRTAKEVKTWVEMEVVDEDGHPMPGRAYTCMLPDGQLLYGHLDRNGRARFEGIDPGNCVFSLTDTHQTDWDWAQAA